MGTYVHVAGWLEVDDEGLEKALAIIRADADDVGHYTASWCAQSEGGGYRRHLFFGCTIRESAVNAVKAQVSRIAREAFSQDGDIKDYPNGMFRAVHENEDVAVEIWHVSGGVLKVQVLENAPDPRPQA
jgi:hypothetical protein